MIVDNTYTTIDEPINIDRSSFEPKVIQEQAAEEEKRVDVIMERFFADLENKN